MNEKDVPSNPPTRTQLPGVHSPNEILPGLFLSKLKLVPDEEWDAHKKAEEAKKRRALVEWLQSRGQCNFPKRQWNAKDLDRSGVWGETERKIQERLGKNGLLLGLVGLRGNGKTQLGVEAMRYVTGELALSAYFVTATGFITDLKATFKEDATETERDVIRRYLSYHLLVMDEFARRGETDWENNQLFELLNRRYADQKDTILISNQEREEAKKTFGDSLTSRMIETGALIECDWPSYR